MSKIVTVTFLVDDDFADLELVKDLMGDYGIKPSVSMHDYPDASEKSKWDRLDIPHANQARYFDPGCTDSCCNQAV